VETLKPTVGEYVPDGQAEGDEEETGQYDPAVQATGGRR
jgi:hypothetical protein